MYRLFGVRALAWLREALRRDPEWTGFMLLAQLGFSANARYTWHLLDLVGELREPPPRVLHLLKGDLPFENLLHLSVRKRLFLCQSVLMGCFNTGRIHWPFGDGDAWRAKGLAEHQGDAKGESVLALGRLERAFGDVFFRWSEAHDMDPALFQKKEGFASLVIEAAGGRDPDAALVAALLYVRGFGVPCDLDTYIRWLRISAEGGCPAAQTALGFHLGAGKDIERDEVAGRRWLEVAGAQGFAPASEALDYLRTHNFP